jgi:hypothetical protein
MSYFLPSKNRDRYMQDNLLQLRRELDRKTMSDADYARAEQDAARKRDADEGFGD